MPNFTLSLHHHRVSVPLRFLAKKRSGDLIPAVAMQCYTKASGEIVKRGCSWPIGKIPKLNGPLSKKYIFIYISTTVSAYHSNTSSSKT